MGCCATRDKTQFKSEYKRRYLREQKLLIDRSPLKPTQDDYFEINDEEEKTAGNPMESSKEFSKRADEDLAQINEEESNVQQTTIKHLTKQKQQKAQNPQINYITPKEDQHLIMKKYMQDRARFLRDVTPKTDSMGFPYEYSPLILNEDIYKISPSRASAAINQEARKSANISDNDIRKSFIGIRFSDKEPPISSAQQLTSQRENIERDHLEMNLDLEDINDNMSPELKEFALDNPEYYNNYYE